MGIFFVRTICGCVRVCVSFCLVVIPMKCQSGAHERTLSHLEEIHANTKTHFTFSIQIMISQ